MNTVLVQELIRYNRLIEIMKDSLINLKKGIKGLVVLSEDLEKIGNSLFDNQVIIYLKKCKQRKNKKFYKLPKIIIIIIFNSYKGKKKY